MSNPHGINLGIKFLIIEVTEYKGDRGGGVRTLPEDTMGDGREW
jgi:hypothetical protein